MKTSESDPLPSPSKCPKCKIDFKTNVPFCPRCGFDVYYGTPKRVDRGQCIYCGTACHFSREHIYGKWLKEKFGNRHSSVSLVLSRPENFIGEWKPTPVHSRLDEHPGGHYDQVVLNVCEGCNNGWMSALHGTAGPLIIELATGTWRTFAPDDLKILARWIAMVSINIQCLARQLTATEFQRKQLMSGNVPDGWTFYAGKMLDRRHAGKHFNRAMSTHIEMDDNEFLPLTSCYFVIERAAFFTFSSIENEALQLALLSTGASERFLPLYQLHPKLSKPRSYSWKFLTLSHLDAIQEWFGPIESPPTL